MKKDFLKLKEWLNLTNQQHIVLRAIGELQDAPNSKPKNIEEKYRELSGKYMQKTNLFGLLKLLVNRQYVIKDDKMNYRLNVNAIRDRLELEKEKISSQEEEIAQYIENPQGVIGILDKRTDSSIVVNVINKNQFYDKISTKVTIFDEYYNISGFPSLFFTETISKRINRDKYVETLEKECFQKKKLRIHYLTNLDIARVYKHALNIFSNKKEAIKETELAIQRFATLIKDNKNLFIYFSERKQDWEFIIPFTIRPKELFLILRSKDVDKPGILHIISNDVAEKALGDFTQRIKNAERIDKDNISKFVRKLKSELRKL